MNIVVLSQRVPFPPNKGEKIRTYNQLEYLRGCGFDVTVFCPLHDNIDENFAAEYQMKTGVTVISHEAGFSKLRMFAGLFKLRPLSVSNFHSPGLQSKLDQYLANTTVDAIYCTSSAMAEYVFNARLQANHRPRKIVDFMDLDSDKWRQYIEVSRLPMFAVYRYESNALLKYEKKVQKHFDQCIFISENEVELFQKSLEKDANNLQVVGNGVDFSVFRVRAQLAIKPPLTLLFSGVMDYLPNENAMIWFMEHVWQKLRDVHPEVRLIIAGMRPTPAVVALAGQPNITVTGFVSDMVASYHEANVFIAPFQMARGVQNKVLQAFACGLPVVSTALGVEGIDCVEDQHYLGAKTADEFVTKITELTADAKKYADVCHAALELVRTNYTWELQNQRLPELLASSV